MNHFNEDNTAQIPALKLPTGLSKREYFAGLTMHAIIPNWNLMKGVERDEVADIAVEMADPLLRKLKNKK